MTRSAAAGLALCLALAMPAWSAPVPDETNALQCWWRTSASAIRIAEPFTLVLTCAARQTDALTAVVDRPRLDPKAIDLPPFEVLGGSVAPETRDGDRVFLQYEYQLRLVTDTSFNQDVPLPSLSVVYRLQTPGAGQNAATVGMERRFAMPRETVRVASLVPAEASDIRDATSLTFTDAFALASRGRTLTMAGSILTGLGALVALVGVVRGFGGRTKASASTVGLLRDAEVLRHVGRELAAVRRDRQDAVWTADLAARALASSRIVAEYALSRTASQRVAARGPVPPGSLLVERRWPTRLSVWVSGSVTPKTFAHELARRATADAPAAPRLEALGRALVSLTEAEYGGVTPLPEEALDETLASVEQLARRLARESTWPLRPLRALVGRSGPDGFSR